MQLKLQQDPLNPALPGMLQMCISAAIRICRKVVVCLVLLLSLSSCREAGPEQTPKFPYNENMLRFDLQTPLGTPRPYTNKIDEFTYIYPFLYSYLFVPDSRGTLKPDLATTWSYDRSNKTWTIQLRQDAFFHDQTPVTSLDVKSTLENGLFVDRPFCKQVVRMVETPDLFRLHVRLNRDDPDFLKKIWDAEIVSHASMRPGIEKAPVGSGPFRLIKILGDQKMVLAANPDYYGGRPDIDRVVFYYQPDKEKSWTRLLAGDTDVAIELTPKNYEIIKDQAERFYFDRYALRWYAILLYNMTKPLFSDTRVRKALAHAINRRHIVDHILDGYAKVAVGPLGVDNPYHDPQIKPLAYDPQKALQLLGQAGWRYDNKSGLLKKGGQAFEFEIIILAESQIEKKVARYIQICLNEIGIRAYLKALPTREYLSRFVYKSNYETILAEASWSDRHPEVLQYLWSAQSSRSAAVGGFNNPQATCLIELVMGTKDARKQLSYLRRLEALLTDLQPGTFLFHKTALDVMSKRFQLSGPFKLTHEGFYHLKGAKLAGN